MKGRHQLRRRFSLQPSFIKEENEERHRSSRSDKAEEKSSGTGGRGHVRHKVVVMGAAKVGKSSLITQFLHGSFSNKYRKTIEEMHHGEFIGQGVHLTLDILDTSGSYEFPAMRALSISSADAFILVYDLTDRSSFDETKMLRDQIHEIKTGTDVPIVVVGNKLDLAEDCREVERDIAENIVSVEWENGFVEASAKDNINVNQVFKELLAQAKVKYSLSPALRRRRRQSLPPHAGHVQPVTPSPAQLLHLEQIREHHSGGKRNSCIIS